MRRQIGRGLDAISLGPQEMPYRVVSQCPGARLRAYHRCDVRRGPVLLIIPAPFKQAYLWDLLPPVSVVRRCLERAFRVFLLEWLVPTQQEDEFGLADYADRLILEALMAIRAETGSSAPILVGHSLGGTLAAIFATLHPDQVGRLLLLDAPLVFGEQAVRALPHASTIRRSAGSPVPGSVISALCVAAAPEIFQLQRVTDFAASMLDPEALAVHLRVERWTYDEFPLPGRLFEDILERLYREDRLMNGTLQVGERQTGIARLRSPVLAVVNPVGGLVPPRSMLDALAAVPTLTCEVLEYAGGRGPMVQHLGPLVAPVAHQQLWPKVAAWAEQSPKNPRRDPGGPAPHASPEEALRCQPSRICVGSALQVSGVRAGPAPGSGLRSRQLARRSPPGTPRTHELGRPPACES